MVLVKACRHRWLKPTYPLSYIIFLMETQEWKDCYVHRNIGIRGSNAKYETGMKELNLFCLTLWTARLLSSCVFRGRKYAEKVRFLRKIALSLAIAPSSSSSSSRSPLHCESCLPDECGRGSNHALVKTVHCHRGSTAGGYVKQCCYPSGVFSIQFFYHPARGSFVVVMAGS